MSDSSQPKISLDDYLKDILITDTIDLSGVTNDSSSTITISSLGPSYSTNGIMITMDDSISVGTAGTYTINSDTITFPDSIINWGTEWENSFPDWDRVKDMCEKYPGLKNAFENFKVFYEMIKDDYDNPKTEK